MSFYGFMKGAIGLYYKIFYRINIIGEENLKGGPYVICPNHKSLNDPPLIGTCVDASMRFMAKEELFKNPLFGAALKALGAFPVKRGKSDIGAIKAAVKTITDGENLVIFPEGTRSPKNALHKGKPGAALIAAKAKADIIPIGIKGRYRIFSKITIEIGKPISMKEYFDQRLNTPLVKEITDTKIMPEIARLAGGLEIIDTEELSEA